MKFTLSGPRARHASAAAPVLALAASMVFLPAGSAAASGTPVRDAGAVTVPISSLSSPGGQGVVQTVAAVKPKGPDTGQRSFGVQPSGPRKPDPRPNFTYRNVRPGQVLRDHVAFLNLSDKPTNLTVYAADGYNTASGAFDLLPKAKRSKDLGTWVRMIRSTATIPARSAFITPIEVRVPRNAEPGDHAGGIVASLRTFAKDAKGNQVAIDQRVGTRMYIRVAGKLKPQIGIIQRGADYHSRNPFARGDADVTYMIRNTGNVRLVGTQTIRVSDVLGSSSQAVKVPDMPELLPGYTFTFTTTVRKVLPLVLMTAHVTVDPRSVAGNVDPASAQVSASARFWAMYWPALVLVLLALGAGLRVWLRRRRRGRSPGSPVGAGGAGPAPDAPDHEKDLAMKTLSVPSRSIARRAIGSVTGALVLGTALATGTPALAADSGDLTFMPGKGMDVSPLYTVTSAPCPDQATNVIGRMYGKGFPKEGIVVIPNSDAPVSTEVAFGVPLQDTVAGFASEAGVKLSGKYRVTVQCVNELGTKVFSEFTGIMNFGDATHFTAPVPKTAPAEGVPIGFLAQVFPEFKQGPGPSVATEPGPAAQGAPAEGSPASRATPAEGTDLTPFLIISAAVLALGGVGFLATRRPKESTATATVAPTVEWPDDPAPSTDQPLTTVPAQSKETN